MVLWNILFERRFSVYNGLNFRNVCWKNKVGTGDQRTNAEKDGGGIDVSARNARSTTARRRKPHKNRTFVPGHEAGIAIHGQRGEILGVDGQDPPLGPSAR